MNDDIMNTRRVNSASVYEYCRENDVVLVPRNTYYELTEVVSRKTKELEDAIAKCEKAEKEFKSRTCKFRSPTNCDFCAFHSDCDEHWKEGEAE